MTTEFTETVVETFKVVSCYSCGIKFGIGSQLYKRAAIDAVGSIFCPACGQTMCWMESLDKQRIRELEKKLAWEASEVARQKWARDTAEASLTATKGVVTKMKHRISAGICPCCHRYITQLKAHMASKHPKFVQV